MPPEQLQGMPRSADGDVWAAGALLFFLLCGREPFPLVAGTGTRRWQHRMVHAPESLDWPAECASPPYAYVQPAPCLRSINIACSGVPNQNSCDCTASSMFQHEKHKIYYVAILRAGLPSYRTLHVFIHGFCGSYKRHIGAKGKPCSSAVL